MIFKALNPTGGQARWVQSIVPSHYLDEPKKCFRIFLNGSSIVGRYNQLLCCLVLHITLLMKHPVVIDTNVVFLALQSKFGINARW